MNKKEVNKYIISVKEYLADKYGKVKPEWEGTLSVLKDTLNRYLEVKESINRNGVFDLNTGKKNPLLTTEKDCIATILKLSLKLGISPWDESKIKLDSEDNSEDFIEALTNG